MDTYTYDTPIGKLSIRANEEAILQIRFGEAECTKETPLIWEAYAQLTEYFDGYRKSFNLPMQMVGTEFQKKVWEALCTIPYGETICYGELAKMVGNPKAARAIGMANNKNGFPILIPCHRVIGADGSLTGYAGGLGVKKKLLAIEGVLL